MKETSSVDYRLEKIIGLLKRFGDGDFSFRESFNREGDEVDEIIRRLNRLGEHIQQSGKVISDYEKRVTAIMDVLLRYTLFDFSEKAVISEAGDELDAIALALNTLGEELHERIEAERQHRASLEEMAVVMETTADGVVLLDPDGQVTQWNASAERIFGYRRDEVVGNSVELIIADQEHLRDARHLLERVRNGEQVVNYETTRQHRDGTDKELSLTLTPIYRRGRLTSISVVARDITEEKKAQRRLRQSEERFRMLVEGVRDYAIFMLDPAGKVSSWNAGARAIFGFAEEEVSGRNFSLFFPAAEQQAHLPANMLKEAIRLGNASRELYLVRSDGSDYWANLVVTVLADSNQQVTGFSIIMRDLSETRKKDEEIRLYTDKLELKNLELEKKNKELESFSYVASHDLQEPLRKIRTFCSRLLQTDFENLSERGRDYCRRLESAANRMQSLIRDVIAYTSLSANDERCELCDTRTMAQEVLDDFRDEFLMRGGTAELGEMCPAYVMPRQFKRLLANLVGNSLKFASEKRPPLIHISGTQLEQPVTHPKSSGGKYCRIMVRDNGIGFEPHFNEQVFEVFQRLHGQDRYPGTGIGLAICRKIVENHGGFIEAHGELGKGTTITVYLPVEGSSPN